MSDLTTMLPLLCLAVPGAVAVTACIIVSFKRGEELTMAQGTYEARAEWDGIFWVVTVPDLAGREYSTQGADRKDAEYMARDLIALVLETSIRTVGVTVTFGEGPA